MVCITLTACVGNAVPIVTVVALFPLEGCMVASPLPVALPTEVGEAGDVLAGRPCEGVETVAGAGEVVAVATHLFCVAMTFPEVTGQEGPCRPLSEFLRKSITMPVLAGCAEVAGIAGADPLRLRVPRAVVTHPLPIAGLPSIRRATRRAAVRPCPSVLTVASPLPQA